MRLSSTISFYLGRQFLAWVGKTTEAGFVEMNEALKARVEARVTAGA